MQTIPVDMVTPQSPPRVWKLHQTYFQAAVRRISAIHQSCRKLQLTRPSSLYQMTVQLNHAGARGCLSRRWALQASTVAYTAVSSLLFIRYKGEGPRPPKTKTTRTTRRINLPSVTKLYTHGSIKLENSYILQAKLFGWEVLFYWTV